MFHLWTKPFLRVGERGIALVVDGDRTFRHFAMRAMRRIGCPVVGLRDAEEALRWLDTTQREPALITTDSVLPRASGFSLCEALRRHERSATAPILCVSSLVALEHRLHALRVGADVFLEKPVRPDLYIEAAQDLIRTQSRRNPDARGAWIRDRAM